MDWITHIAVRLIQAGQRAYTRKGIFLVFFAIAFLGSVVALGQLDLLPDTSPTTTVLAAAPTTPQSELASAVTLAPLVVELPTKIEIPKINLYVSISNPTTTNIPALDRELLKGAVRYPTSAKLNETGNVVLFGHSSYLPIVNNQAYKAFNGIQKLVAGDVVTVYSSSTAYTYRVRSFTKESTNNAGIPLSVDGRVLTLSTCDSFGATTDRFVVVADFVESHSLAT